MNAPRSPLERARLARRMWQAYSAGRIGGDVREVEGGAELQVVRDGSPEDLEYPSLVDPSLVWLALEVTAPGDPIALLRWSADRSVSVEIDLGLPAAARPGFERTAQAIVFDAGQIEPPRIDLMDVGRGAWEQAGVQAEPRPCSSCPFALGSNLDCPVCRDVVIGRKSFSGWSRARVAEGLRALDFDPDLASMVALETELALARFHKPMLSFSYFDAWGRRFGHATRDLFANEDDLVIARDMIEAQMVQPWFRGPPYAERALPVPLPPSMPDDTVPARARSKIRELVEAGVSRWQAERHVAQSLTLRQLLAAEGELVTRSLGVGVWTIHGAFDRLTLAIGDGQGEPWILEVATPIGRAVEVRRSIPDDARADLERALKAVHTRLMEAIAQERLALGPRDDRRAIALALENLRGEIGGPANDPKTTPPTRDREEEAELSGLGNDPEVAP